MSEAVFTRVTYRAGCEWCCGLGVQWEGEDAKDIAMKHARQTGHKGVWFERESHKVYNVTEPLSQEDWDALENRPTPTTVPTPPITLSDFTLGRRIKAARRAAGLTQAQLAERMGMVRTTVIAIEQGERRVDYEELSAIAAEIKTTAADLIAMEVA